MKRNHLSKSPIYIKGDINIDGDGIVGGNGTIKNDGNKKHSLLEILALAITIFAGLIAIYSFFKGE